MNHPEFIEAWCRAYEQRFGQPYVFHGGKDGSAVKRLLVNIPGEKAIETAKLAWDAPNSCWSCRNMAGSIASFASAYSKIVIELSRYQPAPSRRGF